MLNIEHNYEIFDIQHLNFVFLGRAFASKNEQKFEYDWTQNVMKLPFVFFLGPE